MLNIEGVLFVYWQQIIQTEYLQRQVIHKVYVWSEQQLVIGKHFNTKNNLGENQ